MYVFYIHMMSYTDDEIVKIDQSIVSNTKLSLIENECHLWNLSLNRDMPVLKIRLNGVNRSINIPRYMWVRSNKDYDKFKYKIERTCNDVYCVNIEHFNLIEKYKKKTNEEIWNDLESQSIYNDGCLIYKSSNEYINGTFNGKSEKVHRISFIIKKNNGEKIPETDGNGDKLVIRHSCNKKGCILPDHLSIGTYSQNLYDDKVASNTLLCGEKSCNSTITEEVALKIKHSLRDVNDENFMTVKERSIKYNVSENIISSIDKNDSWSHLPDRFGVIISNDYKREKARKRNKKASERIWTIQDFTDAMEKIKSSVTKSIEGKGGSLPHGKCWVWNMSKNDKGYGRFGFLGKKTFAHIISCESKHKRHSSPGEIVRHLCDNKSCCNPDHLEFGTSGDNRIDTLNHGKSKNVKLNPDMIRSIRSSCDENKVLAFKYGVTTQTIWEIKSGKTWKHVV